MFSRLLLFPALIIIAGGASRPNIIVIMTDDQGYAPIGRHGHPWIKTPNLDKLYDQSTRLTRFLVSPTCSPTRSALISGRHPLKNGVTHTILERERLALDTTTLPQLLKKAGYASGIFGKWHLGDEDPYQPHNRGFDEAFIHGSGGIGQEFRSSSADVPGNKYFDPIIKLNGSFVKTKGYCTDLFFTAAMGWVREFREKDKPFFAYITTNAPHAPFIAPPANTKRFTELGFSKRSAGYYGMIENIDENMGRLMQKLAEWDLEENTVLIFLSDNGMTGSGCGPANKALGTTKDGKAMMMFNAGQKGLKNSVDEGGVRVPFFIRWKGTFEAGQDLSNVAAHIDLYPTLADLAGVPVPTRQSSGRSFLPILKNSGAPWPDRYLFTHKARWPKGADPDQFQWKDFAIRNHRYRLSGDQLFDMLQDPGQTTNVAAAHPEVVQKMHQAYAEFWQEARPLMVNENVPLSKNRPYWEQYKRQMAGKGIPDWQPPAL